MSTKITRTYGSKKNHLSRPISQPLRPENSSLKRKRPLQEQSNIPFESTHLPPKRAKTIRKSKEILQKNEKQKSLTQLHFAIDQTVLRACPRCQLTYTKGAPDDESLHRVHCARIQKGMEWGREEEKEASKNGLIQVSSGIKLKDGTKGRIICFPANVGGKAGSKLTSLLETINLTLSSPPLSSEVLLASKAYIFLLSPSTTISTREKIAGCVIAQRISSAMKIASPLDCDLACQLSEEKARTPTPTAALVAVDTSTGLFCHPTPIPTPLGIPRLFVPYSHRRQGIASHLLSAAAQTFIHGCPLDPHKGQVAFTQPTGDGKAVMEKWGGGSVRIYEE